VWFWAGCPCHLHCQTASLIRDILVSRWDGQLDGLEFSLIDGDFESIQILI
jgi:hypothetical protein